jgi:hypothetical protein
MSTLPLILGMRPEQLIKIPAYEFDEALAAPGDEHVGRLELWEQPVPGHTYVVGADFAKGMERRDFDAAAVFDTDTDPVRQVFEAHGHWGPELFDKVLYCILRFYNDAFLLGERQEGLTVLRRLLSDYGHGWLYYDRREDARSRRLTDKLGYWRSSGDVVLPTFRRDFRAGLMVIRSRATLGQMGRLQYKPRTSIDPESALDKDLEIKLAGGGSPDLVMAAAYAWFAVNEVPHFERPQIPKAIPGSNADIMGHEELFYDPSQHPRHLRRRRG